MEPTPSKQEPRIHKEFQRQAKIQRHLEFIRLKRTLNTRSTRSVPKAFAIMTCRSFSQITREPRTLPSRKILKHRKALPGALPPALSLAECCWEGWWELALAIPGVGPLIATGPIVAALAGVGVGGAVGGIAGALIGMGIPEYEAKRYQGRVKDGGILLSVHRDDRNWTARAKQILERTGAQDVASTGESAADWQKSDKPLPRAN